MQIEWSEKFRSGVEIFDAGHKRLIDLINELQRQITKGGGKGEIGKVVAKIYDLKKSHFAEEEQLMLDHNYPQYGQHSKRHAEMLDRLSQLKQGLVDGNNMVTVELTGFLTDWLIQHVAEEDTECGKFFNLKGVH